MLDIEQMLANNASMAAIAKLVSQDAALTATVFKVMFARLRLEKTSQ